MSLLDKYGIDKNSIDTVSIYLDDNVPEDMEGILRIGSVLVDTNNKQFDIQELVNNDEFTSESEIENYVNNKLEINFAQIIE